MGHDAELLAAAGFVGGYPRKDMWGEWLFSGDADDTFGSNDGVVSGASLVPDRFGDINSAYDFVGPSGDRITMSNVADPVNVSVFMWIKPDGTPEDDRMISWRTDGNEYLILRILSGKIQVLWANGVTGEQHLTDNIVVSSGVNQSIGFTLENANDPIIYHNGLSVASTQNGVSGRNLASGVFTFGGDASGQDFNGIIDDIPIWSAIKTPAEMLSIHNRSKP